MNSRFIKMLEHGTMGEVQVIRDKETIQSIDKVSQLINGLSIKSADNNTLVNAMVEMCQLMEHSAYMQGLELGLKLNNLN